MVKKADEIDRILKNYIDLVDKAFYIKKAFLFGSYANGNPNDNSDIDVAIVSPDFKYIPEERFLKILFRLARNVELSIEPIGFTEEDLKDKPLGSVIYDIARSGKLIFSR